MLENRTSYTRLLSIQYIKYECFEFMHFLRDAFTFSSILRVICSILDILQFTFFLQKVRLVAFIPEKSLQLGCYALKLQHMYPLQLTLRITSPTSCLINLINMIPLYLNHDVECLDSKFSKILIARKKCEIYFVTLQQRVISISRPAKQCNVYIL